MPDEGNLLKTEDIMTLFPELESGAEIESLLWRVSAVSVAALPDPPDLLSELDAIGPLGSEGPETGYIGLDLFARVLSTRNRPRLDRALMQNVLTRAHAARLADALVGDLAEAIQQVAVRTLGAAG